MNFSNLLAQLSESGASHESMSAIINQSVDNHILAATEEDVKALVSITNVYFDNYFQGKNPLGLFKTLKESNFEFKGIYKPLNDISTEEYLSFLAGDFELVEEQQEPVKAAEEFAAGSEIAAYYNDEFTYLSVERVDENGLILAYSRKHGEVKINPREIQVRRVEQGSVESLVAQVELSYADGETIYLYDEDETILFNFIPVKIDDKFHVYNKLSNEVYNKPFDNLIALVAEAVKRFPKTKYVEVL